MLMTDINLPIFEYESDDSFENGLAHGKTFKVSIKELIQIRTNLLLKRSPHLKEKLEEFAKLQFAETKKFDLDLAREIEGIAQGSESSVTDIIILNNYTDFRDIQFQKEVQDEGCTSLSYIDEDVSIAGQTWDMHQSAKNYLMLLKVKDPKDSSKTAYIYTVCGCLGLMAINNSGQFIGVNNINVVDGKNGIIWPALIRKVALQQKQEDIIKLLMESNITSGHNYLISDGSKAFNYEITPTAKEVLKPQTKNLIYHTNHCLADNIIAVEDVNNISKTTTPRYELAKKYEKTLNDESSIYQFLTSHDGHPISICSHYAPEGAADPSQTCGGALYNYKSEILRVWRGCKEYDDNFIEVEIPLPLI